MDSCVGNYKNYYLTLYKISVQLTDMSDFQHFKRSHSFILCIFRYTSWYGIWPFSTFETLQHGCPFQCQVFVTRERYIFSNFIEEFYRRHFSTDCGAWIGTSLHTFWQFSRPSGIVLASYNRLTFHHKIWIAVKLDDISSFERRTSLHVTIFWIAWTFALNF